jgi:hypothetical protein
MSTEFCLVAAHRAAAMLAVRGIAEKRRGAQLLERLGRAMPATTREVRRHIPGRA